MNLLLWGVLFLEELSSESGGMVKTKEKLQMKFHVIIHLWQKLFVIILVTTRVFFSNENSPLGKGKRIVI